MSLYDEILQIKPLTKQYKSVTISLDIKGRILKASDGFYELIGYTRVEVENEYNNQFNCLIIQEDRELFLKNLLEQSNNTDVIELEFRIQKKDNTIVCILMPGYVILLSDGKKELRNIIIDNTALMLSEEKLEQIQVELQKEIDRDKNEIKSNQKVLTKKKLFLTKNNRDLLTQRYNKNHISELANYAFEIMSNTKDVNSAIFLILDKVVKYCNASHICIMEKKVDDISLDITYLWSSTSGKVNKESFVLFNSTQWERYPGFFDEHGISYISDFKEFNKTEKNNIGIDYINSKAILQCGIFEEDIFKGCVCIDDCNKTRLWTRQEVDSLVTVTRILSTYLLKIRASERAHKRLEKIRNYDSLTALPTLHKFKRDAHEILKANSSKHYAVVYSDICNFKYINDTLSYEEGDRILCNFAKLIKREEMTNLGVARVSSDKFISLMEYCDAQELVKRINKINEQFYTEQKARNFHINISIISGICLVDLGDTDIVSIIDKANIARKSLKGSLKSCSKFYNPSMLEIINKEMEIASSMVDALKNREFIVYLQPKVSLGDNKIVGAEALVRWQKPNRGLIPPNDFIPLFEKNGFVVNLDFYVYEEVCKLLKDWLDKGMDGIPISVNVSRVHLNNENFVHNFKELVTKYNIPPRLLELELTESMFLDNTEKALTTMKELRNSGFGVSIDDFGAGYSSLNLLKDMATDVLKLDKEFFGQGEMQKEEQIIVSSIINMAKQLNMKVLSEGVETQLQSDFLKGVSCDMAQGFLYAKPMPIDQFEDLMIRN